jgi:hypothetical protein
MAAMMMVATASPAFARAETTHPNDHNRGKTTTTTGNGGGNGTLKCERHGNNGAIISETGNWCSK